MTDTEVEAHFRTGQRAWENGADMPPWPGDDAKIRTPSTLYWLGYMFERGRDFFRRRDMALYPDTVEPRPR